jgi:hypothetical protein
MTVSLGNCCSARHQGNAYQALPARLALRSQPGEHLHQIAGLRRGHAQPTWRLPHGLDGRNGVKALTYRQSCGGDRA